jgi:acetylornithine deacetylase
MENPEHLSFMTNSLDKLQQEAIALLQELISIPSFSKEEWETASVISRFLAMKGMTSTRVGNNVFVSNLHFDTNKPTILLNSHHDTVKPNVQYTRNPFAATIENGKLYGLGSNDAGGCLVSLLATFLHFYEQSDLKYNLVFAATAEEEISGTGGIEQALKYLPSIDCAIVGEPTLMQMAVAERGLMVIDGTAKGKAGHAARNEGENAVYKAMMDIEWIYCYTFEKASELLGPTKMSVTVIETENKAHNVVPAQCRFVLDVRVNELYTFEEVLDIIKNNTQSEMMPRSTRLRSSMIPLDHPLVKAGLSLDRSYYGSPTTSDKALMPFPALKMGPGDSARSHSADEFIYTNEIKEGIDLYIQLLNKVL